MQDITFFGNMVKIRQPRKKKDYWELWVLKEIAIWACRVTKEEPSAKVTYLTGLKNQSIYWVKTKKLCSKHFGLTSGFAIIDIALHMEKWPNKESFDDLSPFDTYYNKQVYIHSRVCV